MQGVPEQFDSPADRAQFHQPPHRAGIELYRAHIVHHAFAPHSHDGFGLGAIASGAERFRYAGTDHLAPAGSIVMLNPDTLHTGRAAADGGWRYHMIYLDEAVVTEVSGETGWWFPEAVAGRDVARARRVGRTLGALWQAAEPLAFDSLLAQLLGEFAPHARRPAPPRGEKMQRFEPVIEFMRAHLANSISLGQLAALAALSPFHFLRSFKARYSATPQQMLMALRLDHAKRLLAAGHAPAAVAASCGLCDQAHLTRAFACRYGVTPARYQQQLGCGPAQSGTRQARRA
ncbi:MAG: AraC family transcriptional regulator [Pseudomonadota bacterium]